MARARFAKHPTPKELEPPQTPQSAVSKAEAIRQALAEGLDSLDDIAEFIKSKYGLEMPRTMISSYKAQQKARSSHKAVGSKKSQAVEDGDLAPPPKVTPTGEGDLIDLLEKMKPLIAMHGAEKIKRIVDLLE